jgi:muramoyltetrapeptide carboxypeptidase
MKSSRIPNRLLPGDEIRIVAPASIVEKDYVDKALDSLTKLGYKATLGKNIFSGFNQFAGSDIERISDFQNAVNDPQVKAIFCARGGYGSIRVISKIDFLRLKRNPKWIVGFSDITVFHSLLNNKFNIATLHSPMPVNFEKPHFHENLAQLNLILKGQKPTIELNSNSLNRIGYCKGKVMGGNLSILCSLQSTPYEIDTKNKILFIEDVGEQLYHLDRMMNNFLLSGKLTHLKGLIVGGMTDMQDKKRPFGKTAYEIIFEAVKYFSYPVLFDFPAGHTDNNVPFILGAEAALIVDHKQSVIKYT